MDNFIRLFIIVYIIGKLFIPLRSLCLNFMSFVVKNQSNVSMLQNNS